MTEPVSPVSASDASSSDWAPEDGAPSEWGAVWRARGLLKELIRRDLRERYAGSAAGSAWNIIHPLLLIGIYILIFSTIYGSRFGDGNRGPRFVVYLGAGIIPWFLFSDTIGRCAGCFLNYGALLKKSAFPKSILPLTVAATSLVSFGVMFTIYMAYLAGLTLFAGESLPLSSGQLFAALGVVALMEVFAIGLGFALATLNVFLRDVGQIVAVGLQILFWATPVVWLPEHFASHPRLLFWLKANPLYWFIDFQHQIFAPVGDPLSSKAWPMMLGATAAAVAAGALAYRALRKEIVDVL